MAPFYYRWCFDSKSGSVLLSHNEEDHPAKVRYHTDLAEEIPGDTHHGYAYRIGRGWRLTDWEHNPLADPFIAASVLRELRQKEGFHDPHPELDWREAEEEPEYDQFHYGLPTS